MASSSFSVKRRAVFAGQHISSAILFTNLCADLENKYQGQSPSMIPPNATHEQKAYVTAAVFSSVAFLEASINELFTDAVELEAGKLAGTFFEHLDPDLKVLMADMWLRGIPRTAKYSVQEKYNIALTLARKPLLKGQVYDEAHLAIILRNALTHYEPLWTMEFTSDPVPNVANPFYFEIYKGPLHERTSSNKIKNLKTKVSNPLLLETEPFFPDKCLCHDCAKWTVISCMKFAEEFYTNLGITNYPSQSMSALLK